jgi:hypothetical protein
MSKWLEFLRHYGPIARNDNMYDETIRRLARRKGNVPIAFLHPLEASVVACFDRTTPDPVSLVLTGTAGEGKTHICYSVWALLGGDEKAWATDESYLSLKARYPKNRQVWPDSDDPALFREITVHFIRDLSGWAPQQGLDWIPERRNLLHRFHASLQDPASDDLFLVAANDGQLLESWRRLDNTEEVNRTRLFFEQLLVEDLQERPGFRVKVFNLSKINSAHLFQLAVDAFLKHPGWEELKALTPGDEEVFGAKCPIRRNYELLHGSLVQGRIKALLSLCEHNGLHVPIRQLLLLLANAVLGHPDVEDHLMRAEDIPTLIQNGTVARASLFNNVFGGNLPEHRKRAITLFDYLDRFQIGFETSNRVDNILIFGDGDEHLQKHFEELVAKDQFYGADASFYAARNQYIEGAEEDEQKATDFLDMLVSQRRGLFFKIQHEMEEELSLWELTVFKFAGEYLGNVVNELRNGRPVRRSLLGRLVKGMNRIFTGMLVNHDREVVLASSGNFSQAKVSRVFVDRISVEPSRGERVSLKWDANAERVNLLITLSPGIQEELPLSLIRYEFLSRVAMDGALPASFSKECYEDILAFKSQVLAAWDRRRAAEGIEPTGNIELKILSLTAQGQPDPYPVEVLP